MIKIVEKVPNFGWIQPLFATCAANYVTLSASRVGTSCVSDWISCALLILVCYNSFSLGAQTVPTQVPNFFFLVNHVPKSPKVSFGNLSWNPAEWSECSFLRYSITNVTLAIDAFFYDRLFSLKQIFVPFKEGCDDRVCLIPYFFCIVVDIYGSLLRCETVVWSFTVAQFCIAYSRDQSQIKDGGRFLGAPNFLFQFKQLFGIVGRKCSDEIIVSAFYVSVQTQRVKAATWQVPKVPLHPNQSLACMQLSGLIINKGTLPSRL